MGPNMVLQKLWIFPVVPEGSIMGLGLVPDSCISSRTLACDGQHPERCRRLPLAPVDSWGCWACRAAAVLAHQGEGSVIYVACRRIHWMLWHFHLFLVPSFFSVPCLVFSGAVWVCLWMCRERLPALPAPQALPCSAPGLSPLALFPALWHSLNSSSIHCGTAQVTMG